MKEVDNTGNRVGEPLVELLEDWWQRRDECGEQDLLAVPRRRAPLSERCCTVQRDNCLACTGGASDPRRSIEFTVDDRPLVRMQENHPVLDRRGSDPFELLRREER